MKSWLTNGFLALIQLAHAIPIYVSPIFKNVIHPFWWHYLGLSRSEEIIWIGWDLNILQICFHLFCAKVACGGTACTVGHLQTHLEISVLVHATKVVQYLSFYGTVFHGCYTVWKLWIRAVQWYIMFYGSKYWYMPNYRTQYLHKLILWEHNKSVCNEHEVTLTYMIKGNVPEVEEMLLLLCQLDLYTHSDKMWLQVRFVVIVNFNGYTASIDT